MATFPRTEPEIMALAMTMISGLNDNAAAYPAPPVTPVDLGTAFGAYNTAKSAQTAALAAAEAATMAKDDALDDLVEAMKTDVRYAENTVNFDDDQLKLIGWAGPRPLYRFPARRDYSKRHARGLAGSFSIGKSHPTAASPTPTRSCAASARQAPGKKWPPRVISEATLVEQPTSKELEYRIIAINKTGDGEPSNTVMVVL